MLLAACLFFGIAVGLGAWVVCAAAGWSDEAMDAMSFVDESQVA